MGGLRQDSDVDVLVVVNQPTSLEGRRTLTARLMEVSGPIGNRHAMRPLELIVVNSLDVVPWHYPPRAEFAYGEWLREAFEKGTVPKPTHDPDLVVVLKTVIDNGVPLFGDDAASLFDPVPVRDVLRGIRESMPKLIAGIDGDERNAILTLARMWLTAATGDIVPKDIAAQWAAHRLPEEHAAIVNEARLGYLGELEDRWQGREDELSRLVRRMQSSVEACLDPRPQT